MRNPSFVVLKEGDIAVNYGKQYFSSRNRDIMDIYLSAKRGEIL